MCSSLHCDLEVQALVSETHWVPLSFQARTPNSTCRFGVSGCRWVSQGGAAAGVFSVGFAGSESSALLGLPVGQLSLRCPSLAPFLGEKDKISGPQDPGLLSSC